MTMAQTGTRPAVRKPLRLWPGVVAVVLQWLARFGLKAVVPGFRGFALGAQGGLIGAVAVVVWWLFFSRAAWSERLGGLVLMIAGLGAAWQLRHESMGPFWLVAYAIPVLCLAFVAWAVASRHLSDGARRATMVATVVLACGVWTLVRTEGISGDHVATFAWRWTKSPEERLLVHTDAAPTAPRSAPTKPGVDSPVMSERSTRVEWPGFRGPERDDTIHGVRIETNWAVSPPVELWRRPIGPGWSSFAVSGDLIYTQEQHGDDEVVACYKASTGEPVWTHRDPARFFESNGGAGPRGTPTVSNGRAYTFGATGILNALNASSGAVVWSRNVAADTDVKVPYWGFSSSPLVVDDVLIVAASGALVAYDLASGKPRWTGKAHGGSYSSPHLVTIDGVAQILLMTEAGAISVAPADGKQLWDHPWPGFPIVQPAMIRDGDVLIAASAASGMRRIAVAHGPGGWTVKERWTSLGLKPYFNDFVVHRGHAFGFDSRILSCIDLEDGTRKWKGGRYGTGQLVLLADQDVLLVLSEEGELALVGATPDQFTEIARFPAIEGKTWNHPVLVGNVLLVRNAEEMAAFRLPLAR
jgi:outer membrane protein assembly factor BamB